ncbi:MAG TPA: choice-of-anchor Q domain-containing protein [Bacteroidia bacterium]|jgi:hypothetical protein|nr:choice-of-anchor Q domain-containing protein [Bacteroidia bacterium]
MRHLACSIFIALLVSSFLAGCRKDKLDTDPNAKLTLSEDTIVFDTVFTTIGSATRHFLVHNTSHNSIKISSITLAGGSNSPFHLNIDGTPTSSISDVIIAGGDSMYIFVDVTIDPNNSNNPLMVEDSILFNTNGNQQKVILDAVGQDAYFHYYETLPCNDVWNNDKPHVIYGYAIVPSGCSLTINAGARVHVHGGGILAVDSAGTLLVQGAYNSPVTFQGDRLESEYANEPGQWRFIWLSGGSVNNVIDWAVIKNAETGIRSDTLGASSNPTLTLTNTKIFNCADYGCVGVAGSWIEGNNDLIGNCGAACFAVAYGGKCKMQYCTFGNNWTLDTRTTPALLLNNWYKYDDVTIIGRDLTMAQFDNCIIYGSLDNEMGLDSTTQAGHLFNYYFNHCQLKTNVNTSQTSHFNTDIINGFCFFHDVNNRDYHLDPGSAAIDHADPLVIVPFDLDNFLRPYNGTPDIGCYEQH